MNEALARKLEHLRSEKTAAYAVEVGSDNAFTGRTTTSTIYAANVSRYDQDRLHLSGEGWTRRVLAANVRSVYAVTPETVAAQYHVGQWVVVRKYGNDYGATVTKVGRTRLTVTFRTRGGARKEMTLSALAVVR